MVERVQRTHPDERIVSQSSADLERDRIGFLAYSKVTATASMTGDVLDVIDSFLGALNLFIAHVRDILNVYWIRSLEREDLFQLTIEIDGRTLATWSTERAGGITLPVGGLSQPAAEALSAALETKPPPPLWRQLLLDARDALDLGRYEDCVILAWTGLEAGCRAALPGLAYQAGIDPVDLAKMFDPKGRNRTGQRGWKSH